MDTSRLKVSNISIDIQREGCFSGIPAIFVRCAPCELTAELPSKKEFIHVNQELTKKQLQEVLKEYKYKYGYTNVIFTGGDPVYQKEYLRNFMINTSKYIYYLETKGSERLIGTQASLYAWITLIIEGNSAPAILTDSYFSELRIIWTGNESVEFYSSFAKRGQPIYLQPSEELNNLEDTIAEVKRLRGMCRLSIKLPDLSKIQY